MLKLTVLIVGFLLLSTNGFCQNDEYLDQKSILVQVERGSGITAEKLCEGSWEVTLSIMQLIFENPEDNMIMDMDYNSYTYQFNTNGSFQVDAILDSDGTWELRNNGKLLYLYNNLREDEELHHILIEGDTLKLYYIVDNSMVYQHLEKKTE